MHVLIFLGVLMLAEIVAVSTILGKSLSNFRGLFYYGIFQKLNLFDDSSGGSSDSWSNILLGGA